MQLSEDGKWMWNGTEWVPAETAPAVQPAMVQQPAIVSQGAVQQFPESTIPTQETGGKKSDKFIGVLGILQGVVIIGISVWLILLISDVQLLLEEFTEEFDECDKGTTACGNWIDGMNSTMMTWKVLHGIGIAIGVALIFFSAKMFTANEGRRKAFFIALGGAVAFFFIVGYVEYTMYNSMMEDTEEFTDEEQESLGLWESNGMVQFFSNTCCLVFVGLLALFTRGKKDQQTVVVQQQMPQMYQ